jgi:hypothetical protein
VTSWLVYLGVGSEVVKKGVWQQGGYVPFMDGTHCDYGGLGGGLDGEGMGWSVSAGEARRAAAKGRDAARQGSAAADKYVTWATKENLYEVEHIEYDEDEDEGKRGGGGDGDEREEL